MKYIEEFIDASGSDPETINLFDRLPVPEVSGSLKDAVLLVKSHIMKTLGFQYDDSSFMAHDVLSNKRGNCLGLPLLISSILHGHGYEPHHKIIVTPRDATFRLERRFFEKLEEDMSYDNPQLATESEPFPAYRFSPLEHLVIGNGDFAVEVTSDESSVPDAESVREVTFTEALSGVYKDRAVTELYKGNIAEALKLADEGLKKWNKNGEIYLIIAACADSLFDDERYESAVDSYKKLKRDDTLSDMGMFSVTGDLNHVDSASARYPAAVGSTIARAVKAIEKDPREARFLFSLASHCYANSRPLDLINLYVAYGSELSQLFGQEVVRDVLVAGDENWGDINYHLSVFNVTGSEDHLAEAQEAIETPTESLRFLAASKGTNVYDPKELQDLDRNHGSSELYQKMRKDLNI
jgi:tetratricopeptide (TPR) repeat protein